MTDFINQIEPWIGEEERVQLLRVIESTYVTEHNLTKEFEQKIKDLTGAGDLFAAGFLHGYVNKLSLKESLEKGTELSSKIIQQIGARL